MREFNLKSMIICSCVVSRVGICGPEFRLKWLNSAWNQRSFVLAWFLESAFEDLNSGWNARGKPVLELNYSVAVFSWCLVFQVHVVWKLNREWIPASKENVRTFSIQDSASIQLSLWIWWAEILEQQFIRSAFISAFPQIQLQFRLNS